MPTDILDYAKIKNKSVLLVTSINYHSTSYFWWSFMSGNPHFFCKFNDLRYQKMNATHINSSFSKYSSGRIEGSPEKVWHVLDTPSLDWVYGHLGHWTLGFIFHLVGGLLGSQFNHFFIGGGSRVLVDSSSALEKGWGVSTWFFVVLVGIWSSDSLELLPSMAISFLFVGLPH